MLKMVEIFNSRIFFYCHFRKLKWLQSVVCTNLDLQQCDFFKKPIYNIFNRLGGCFTFLWSAIFNFSCHVTNNTLSVSGSMIKQPCRVYCHMPKQNMTCIFCSISSLYSHHPANWPLGSRQPWSRHCRKHLQIWGHQCSPSKHLMGLEFWIKMNSSVVQPFSLSGIGLPVFIELSVKDRPLSVKVDIWSIAGLQVLQVWGLYEILGLETDEVSETRDHRREGWGKAQTNNQTFSSGSHKI